MKSSKIKEFVPKALREVWEWKDSIYQETKDLSTGDALRHISEDGAILRKSFNLPVADFSHSNLMVAEPSEPYGTR